MSDVLGPIVYSAENSEVFLGKDFGTTKNYSEKIAEQIDEEIYNFVTSGYNRALKILEENKSILIFIAEYLVKHEIMDAEQFELCFVEGVTEEMLDAVTERKNKANAAENESRREELERQKAEEAKKIDASADSVKSENAQDDTEVFSDDILNN